MYFKFPSLEELYSEDPILALEYIKNNSDPLIIDENIPIEFGLIMGFSGKKAEIKFPIRGLFVKPTSEIKHPRLFLEYESDPLEINLISPEKEFILASQKENEDNSLESIAKRISPASILQFPGAYEKDEKGNITQIHLSVIDSLIAPYRGTIEDFKKNLKSKKMPIKIYSENQNYISSEQGISIF